MADADVAITAGAGTKIDTRTVGAGTDEHRQVVVIGDPTTAANVATVVSPTDALAAAAGVTMNDQLLIWNGASFDRARTIEGFDTAATNPDTGLLAAWHPDLRFASVSLATAAASTQVWNVNGASSALVRCGTTTTGTYIFEVSADGTNYRSAETRDAAADNWVTGQNITPTSGNNYRIMTIGERLLRVRTVATLGATVAFVTNTTQISPFLAAVRTGPAPHDFGYTGASATAQYTTAQTSTTLGPTISATQRMAVTSIQIQAGGTVSGTVQVYFGTGAYVRGTNKALFDGEFAPSSTSKPGFAMAWPINSPEGALDEELKVTGVGAINPLTITVWYYIVS